MNEGDKVLSKEMGLLVQKFKKSGITQRDFAQKHGIGVSKLKYWLKKHKRPVSKVYPSEAISGFIPIELEETKTASGQLALVRLPNGVTIEVDFNCVDAVFLHTLKTC
jgi:hypothetical protein